MNLHGNDFSDITPLAGLHNLETLVLLKNRVSDISPLAGLTKLEHLDIHRVQMSPFSNGADAGDYRRTRGWRAARPRQPSGHSMSTMTVISIRGGR
ncbi:MAG: leucine-rich repeat domain-containing protein [Planctomycetes bacterium]|nr:leucine-rich repeat domain-containing protein [Planctomycetota bacterium]